MFTTPNDEQPIASPKVGAVLVARSIVNELEPPDPFWSLKPDLCFGPGCDAVIDTYLCRE
ncbi:hypothetical protein IV102_03890 [bacterium]|nr:hypothetical protein [bacterium]